MADKKITALTEATSLVAADIIPVVTDTTGTPTTKKITVTNLKVAVAPDLSTYATLASPTFTGTPTLPTGSIATTQTAADSSTKLATTAFVTTADNLKANLASPTFTGTPLSTTAAVDTNTTQVATTAYVVGQGYAKLASPTLTGTPLAPTATAGTSTTQIATTAFADPQGDQYVLASAVFNS